ncbi:DUF6283 family protein [Pantoea sp. LMR881]|uniref:DUF6283 family protein n=1 Tax=Pantoea sp. LMR881 TaxID=3014336 RepID=UPI0022AEEF12|nr:DUF6283 family protein [Pantoea sp. LMR881]MCZ4061221.1 DUF6283 family protein [Pantoea sp. LMR881]MCZ4061337.1 DUF6283 family protein [Pantoea sp. LMR881]
MITRSSPSKVKRGPAVANPVHIVPWRRDSVGEFPAEAFRHSAKTSYDQSFSVFACHDSGVDHAATCAGFILRGAENNLAIRLAYIRGEVPEVTDGGHALFENYKEMAIANGVEEHDPVLVRCR